MGKRNSNYKKTVNLYSGLGLKSLFARIRFWDAPYQQVEELIPKNGLVIDLGCGEGYFANYLAISSKERSVIGAEVDKARIKYANRGLKNTRFIFGDINSLKLPKADAIVFFHVMHHLDSYENQERLLKICKSKLNKNGKLIIVEVEPKLSLKYFFAYIVDHWVVPMIFEGKLYSKVYFRRSKGWILLLKRLGFCVKAYPADKFMPFSHVIFECNKI